MGAARDMEHVHRINTDSVPYCREFDDEIVVWPQTQAGQEAIVLCPSYPDELTDMASMLGLPQILQTMRSATRLCLEDSTWSVANYSQCIEDIEMATNHSDDLVLQKIALVEDRQEMARLTGILYLAGASLSMVSMTTALLIFFMFRRLRCLRNHIHSQLLISMLLKLLVWFMIYFMNYAPAYMSTTFCKALGVIHSYFAVSQFSWMFLEALNLVIALVHTMALDAVNLKLWLMIGWGLPIPIVIAWAIFNTFNATYKPNLCWLLQSDASLSHGGDYILIAPICLLVVANFILMGLIIWILIKKLRGVTAQVTPWTNCTRQTVKATIVLVPLLGINYILWAYQPDGMFTPIGRVLVYLNVVLQSTQGFCIALGYCFLNGEVKSTLTKQIQHLKDSWTLQTSS